MYSYDRLGRPDKVVDGELIGGQIAVANQRYAHSYQYKSDLKLEKEIIDTVQDYELTRQYEAVGATVGRYQGYDLGTNAAPQSFGSVRYGYDTGGRLETVTD